MKDWMLDHISKNTMISHGYKRDKLINKLLC
jgi:hypothetical protein